MEAEKSAAKRHRTEQDAAFRTAVVRRVIQDGQAATRVAQAVGSSGSRVGQVGAGARPAGSLGLEQENKQLRAQLARAKMERAILKKALTIFSQPTGR